MQFLELTKGLFTIVDDEDFHGLSHFQWVVSESHGLAYAVFRKGLKTFLMHRIIMRAPEGMSVDHIDGNGLNNQKDNLRLCSHAENIRNRTKRNKNGTTKYKGVRKHGQSAGHTARIMYNYKEIHLGTFPTERAAAIAYNEAASLLFGEYASLNILED